MGLIMSIWPKQTHRAVFDRWCELRYGPSTATPFAVKGSGPCRMVMQVPITRVTVPLSLADRYITLSFAAPAGPLVLPTGLVYHSDYGHADLVTVIGTSVRYWSVLEVEHFNVLAPYYRLTLANLGAAPSSSSSLPRSSSSSSSSADGPSYSSSSSSPGGSSSSFARSSSSSGSSFGSSSSSASSDSSGPSTSSSSSSGGPPPPPLTPQWWFQYGEGSGPFLSDSIDSASGLKGGFAAWTSDTPTNKFSIYYAEGGRTTQDYPGLDSDEPWTHFSRFKPVVGRPYSHIWDCVGNNNRLDLVGTSDIVLTYDGTSYTRSAPASLVGAWHSVAVVFNGLSSFIAIDGDYIGPPIPLTLVNSGGNIVYGAIQGGEAGLGYWTDIRLWGAALIPAQLAVVHANVIF